MALTKEDLKNIELSFPLKDEVYVMLHKEEQDNTYNVWDLAPFELKLFYIVKLVECYEKRFPGNKVAIEDMKWTPPFTEEFKDYPVGEKQPILTKEELSQMKLPLSDVDYLKLHAAEEAGQSWYLIDELSELKDAYDLLEAKYFDMKYPGSDVSLDDITWHMPPSITMDNVDDIEDPIAKKIALIELLKEEAINVLWSRALGNHPRLLKLLQRLEENESAFNNTKISNPKMLSYGIQMAFYHIEAGTRDFLSFAKVMEEDIGQSILPYLKSFYNGAREIMLDCGNDEEQKMAAEMDDYYTVEKLADEMKNDYITIEDDCDDDDESDNTLAYMGIGYEKSEEREEIERAGFELIKDSNGIDRGQWAYELIKAYPHEVIDEFGSDPFEVGGLVEEMWDIDEYEDPDSGLTMSWPDWAAFFSTDVAKTVYEKLVEEHQSRRQYEEKAKKLNSTIEQLKSILDSCY